MKIPGLIDTGAIVALLDRRDRWHVACTTHFRQMQKPLATSLAVVTEVFHFRTASEEHLRSSWEFFSGAQVLQFPIGFDDYPRLRRLMLQYADRPMDLADATLVCLAEREKTDLIMSIDSDFDVYRIGGRRSFRRVPKT